MIPSPTKCLSATLLLLSAAFSFAQTTHPIYTDSYQNSWFSNPAGATVNTANTTPVKVGTKSISVRATTPGGTSLFQVSHPVTPVNTTPYRALTFWIHGGSQGGQKLKLAMLRGTAEALRFDIVPAPLANTWTKVAIALSDLGIANAPDFDGIRIIEEPGSGNTFYLDEILLTDEAVPSLAGVIYDEMLRAPWFNNPLNTTLNFLNTSPVYRGSLSLSVTTAAWGAVQLILPGSTLNTAPYKSLTFRIHGGTTGGQNLRVAALLNNVESPRIAVLPTPKANEWSTFSIALEDLGAAEKANLNGIRIWESGGVASTYYLDDVSFSEEAVPPLSGVVYDEVLRGVWFANPFGATMNIANTSPVQAGDKSIACTITGAGGAAQFSHPGTTFDLSVFTSLSFWIHGGTVGNQQLAVSLLKTGGSGPSWTIPAPAANTWTKHTVPLSTLGAEGATDVTALWFRSTTGVAQSVFYLDNVRFDQPSGYSLVYEGNGHTGGSVPVDAGNPHVAGSTATILGNTGNLTRGANFTFTGWNTAADGSGTSYSVGQSIAINRNLLLHATWSYSGPTYAMTYDGNGHSAGGVPVDAASPYIPGATVTIPSVSTLSRAGYTFGGWNTSPAGTGTNYAGGATFAINQATTLYAKWTPSASVFSVVYLGNGQTSGTAPIDAASPRPIYDTVTIADKATLAKSGAPFLGWNTAADGSGTSYYPGDRLQLASNLNLYAQYGTFRYPYEPYNQGLMDPQLTGWPISQAARDYVVNKSEASRRPGIETPPNHQKMTFFPVTPVGGNWGGVTPAAWLDTHALLVDKVLSTPNAEILLVGDSITSQWGGGQMGAFGPVWSAHFGTRATVNLGIGGDKTYNVLWRLDRARLETLQPKVVVLQIGHNNMFFANETGIEAVVDGIVWCVRNLRSKYPRTPIIVVNVFPTLGIFSADLKATHDALNARDLPTADPLVQVLDLWEELGLPDGSGNPALIKALPDGVHLNDAGYEVWAQSLKPLINEVFSPVVRYEGNGNTSGAAPSDTTVYSNGATVTVRENSGNLAKSGHTFAGWNTRPDGSGTNYNGNATFSITASTTLYATWAPSSTVRFTRNVVDAVLVAGQTTTFSVAVSGGTDPTFQWERALVGSGTFAPVVGEKSASLSVTAALTNHGDLYRVLVTSGGSTATSQVGSLQVLPTGWQYALPAGFTEQTYTAVDGLSLGYRLFSPTGGTPPVGGYPLVVVLPGKDATGKPLLNLAVARFVAEQATRKCHIFVPVAPLGKEWSTFVTTGNSPFQPTQTTEMRLLRGAIDALQAGPLVIDDNRLYLTGFNGGGYAVWDLLQREGARWAAAVPVLGGGDNTTIASAVSLPPVWAAHSWENNGLVPVARTREMVTALEAAGRAILYSEYNRILSAYDHFIGHNPPGIVGQQFLPEWMFAQVRGQSEVSFTTVAGQKALLPWNKSPGAVDGGPITSYPAFFTQWKQKRDAWATATTANQGKMIFLGDSITDLWTDVADYFPNLNGQVLNMGISGDMSRGVLTRIQDVIETNPKGVSLLIGTNDLTFYGPNTDAIADIAVNNIKAIIQTLHAHRTDLPIIVSTIMPTGFNRQDVMNTKLKAELAGMPNVWICDVNARFKANGTNGLYTDGLHPSAAGYQLWAEELNLVFASAGLYATEPPTNERAWDGGGANSLWSTPANWNSQRNGLGTNPSSAPSEGNIAVFNTTSFNGAVAATLSDNVTVEGIEVGNTGTTKIYTDNIANRVISLGASGITLNAGAGSVQFAETNAANKKIQFVLQANQSWLNNGTGTLSLLSDASPNINLHSYTLILGGSGNFELPSRIDGQGGIKKTGTGTVAITRDAPSSFTGPLTLQNGIWDARIFANFNTNSDLGKGSSTNNPADLIFGGGTLRHSVANVAATDRFFTLGSANSRSGTLESSSSDPAHTLSFTGIGNLAYGGTGTRTLRLGGTNTGANRFAPSISDGSDGSATSLVKLDMGKWMLTGTSSYTGGTSVNGGTLAIDGTLGNTSVTVASGATLTGRGSIGGAASINDGGRLLLEIASTPGSQQPFSTGGNFHFAPGSLLELAVPTNVAQGTYTLVVAGGITGTVTSAQSSGPQGTVEIIGNSIVFTVTDFDLWRSTHGITGSALQGDLGDGRNNFFKYAFGLDGSAGKANSVVNISSLPSHGKIRYSRRKPTRSGLTYVHEYSTTLLSWQEFTPVSLVADGGDPVESVTVELPLTLKNQQKLFLRVVAK